MSHTIQLQVMSHGLWYGVQGLGSRIHPSGSVAGVASGVWGFRVFGVGCGVCSLGYWVQGEEFTVQGFEFRVSGFGSRDSG